MELNIINTKKESSGKRKLPAVFSEAVRADLIKRAVHAAQANARQPYGVNPRAGKNNSATLSRRRRKYKGAYGKGISRVPRKTMTRRGMQMYWVGAVAPMTVGGRQAHPAKAEKKLGKSINKKERRKAIRSAIAATVLTDTVSSRGHRVPEGYPFLLDDDFEKLAKTKDVHQALQKLGFEEELDRTKERKIRSGKGKRRGRPYKNKRGPLLVVSGDCPLSRSARNIPGVDIRTVENLNAEALAPGAVPGRLTLFTKSAIERMDKEDLFA